MNKALRYAAIAAATAVIGASCNKDKTTSPNGTNPNDTSHHASAARLNRPQLLGRWEFTGSKFLHFNSAGALPIPRVA